jgi:four helix bundle protein
MHNYKNLKIWQNSRTLVKQVYELTSLLPPKEQYGLISQIQRAAISIPANIAEGSGRGSDKDFSRYLDIAIASSFELETEFLLAVDLNYINEVQINSVMQVIQEVQKMIFGFKESLKIK